METTFEHCRIQTSVMLDPDVKQTLRRAAFKSGEKVSDLVNQAVREMLNIPQPKRPKRPKPAA